MKIWKECVVVTGVNIALGSAAITGGIAAQGSVAQPCAAGVTGASSYEVIGAYPSGLFVRPGQDSDFVAVARSVVASRPNFRNNRIVLNAQGGDARKPSPGAIDGLRSLADESGVTIGLRVAVEPFAYEFEPPAAIRDQIFKGAFTANACTEDEVDRLMSDAPQTIRDWVRMKQCEMRGIGVNMGVGEVLHLDILDFLEDFNRHGLGLTSEERAYILKIARRAMKTGWAFGKMERAGAKQKRNPLTLYKIFKALHDFPSLHQLKIYFQSEDNNFDLQISLTDLELFEQLCELADRDASEINSEKTLEEMVGREWFGFCEEYAGRRGYHNIAAFPFFRALRHLSRLSTNYDIVVSIAKGGLFSGAVADLLGMETRVIEVHAHNRKRPSSRFVDEIRREDIEGKRVLLVENDTVTGASIREAVKLLKPFSPGKIGVYFNLPPVRGLAQGLGCTLNALEEVRKIVDAVHHPENTGSEPLYPLFLRVHERLGTTLGRLFKTENAIRDILQEAKGEKDSATTVREFLDEQKRLYFALNHLLPGANAIRERIVSRLEDVLKRYEESKQVPISVLAAASPLGVIANLAMSSTPLPLEATDMYAMSRYLEPGKNLAARRSVENEHLPHSFLSSFRAASMAMRDKYDIALIVGPEGFAYEPIFLDLGLPAVAVNIPESEPGAERTLAAFDDLSQLKGKRVLIVEDDVRTGATLRRLLKELEAHAPAFRGLFLGSPPVRQIQENIPQEIGKVYMAEPDFDEDERVFSRHLMKNAVVFKDRAQPATFRGKAKGRNPSNRKARGKKG